MRPTLAAVVAVWLWLPAVSKAFDIRPAEHVLAARSPPDAAMVAPLLSPTVAAHADPSATANSDAVRETDADGFLHEVLQGPQTAFMPGTTASFPACQPVTATTAAPYPTPSLWTPGPACPARLCSGISPVQAAGIVIQLRINDPGSNNNGNGTTGCLQHHSGGDDSGNNNNKGESLDVRHSDAPPIPSNASPASAQMLPTTRTAKWLIESGGFWGDGEDPSDAFIVANLSSLFDSQSVDNPLPWFNAAFKNRPGSTIPDSGDALFPGFARPGWCYGPNSTSVWFVDLTSSVSPRVFVLDLESWSWSSPHFSQTLPIPGRRQLYSITCGSGTSDHIIWIFGGILASQENESVLWALDTTATEWIRHPSPPFAPLGRFTHVAGHLDDHLVIVGGIINRGDDAPGTIAESDVWVYNTTSQVWTDVSSTMIDRTSNTVSPFLGGGQPQTFDGRLVFFGGSSSTSRSQDRDFVSKWTLSYIDHHDGSWGWTRGMGVDASNARTGHYTALDRDGGILIIRGGVPIVRQGETCQSSNAPPACLQTDCCSFRQCCTSSTNNTRYGKHDS
ncbi:hypothetical protein BC831DRAFT_482536 [Entophlyctis helioformis]|nr:hypothetical protein BC831DRAFT_482536 [Entophlyctis helioformis]